MHRALVVLATAVGTTVLSHVDDSGSRPVSPLETDEATTLKTWTVSETLLGTTGLVLSPLLSLVR